MSRHDYIFADESGDPAFTQDPVSGRLSSSAFYIAAALHLCDDSFRHLNKHVAAFRYYSGLSNYLKMARRHCRRNHRSAHASCNTPR